MATEIPAVPADIGGFFSSLYHTPPDTISKDQKITCYSLKGAGISVATDLHQGCFVDINDLSNLSISYVKQAIARLVKELKRTKNYDSLWVNFPFPMDLEFMGSVCPASFKIGNPGRSDLIYDYQQKKARMWQWLNTDKECTIPAGATHNVGATALLCDETFKKALLVVNVTRPTCWNLPGGSYDPMKDKSPSDTALREAQEESGLTIDKTQIAEERLIGFTEFPKNQFASALHPTWLFVVNGLSEKPLNPPSHEVKHIQWVDYATIQESQGTFNGFTLGKEIKDLFLAATQGFGFQKIVNTERMIVHGFKLFGYTPREKLLNCLRDFLNRLKMFFNRLKENCLGSS